MFSSFLPYLTHDKKSIKKASIVTKTGDTGKTSLWNGEKVNKSTIHICLIGSLDTLNSQLGMIKSLWTKVRNEQENKPYNAPGAGSMWYRHNPCVDSGMYYEWFILGNIVSEIQRLIMDISSLIASPPTNSIIIDRTYTNKENKLLINEENLTNIESLINRINSLCPPITQFTIPGGGGELTSWLDIVRTTVRECERQYVDFILNINDNYVKEYEIEFNNWVINNKLCLKIINRMSDLIFILKRFTVQTLKENEDLYKITKNN